MALGSTHRIRRGPNLLCLLLYSTLLLRVSRPTWSWFWLTLSYDTSKEDLSIAGRHGGVVKLHSLQMLAGFVRPGSFFVILSFQAARMTLLISGTDWIASYSTRHPFFKVSPLPFHPLPLLFFIVSPSRLTTKVVAAMVVGFPSFPTCSSEFV